MNREMPTFEDELVQWRIEAAWMDGEDATLNESLKSYLRNGLLEHFDVEADKGEIVI